MLICKPVLKLDFTSHGIMGSLSEFGFSLPTKLTRGGKGSFVAKEDDIA
jgi:hypothetical protein